MYNPVLAFWFEEIEARQWWASDQGFDAHIRYRFGDLVARARQGELFSWREHARGRLAEIIILDQFSRNIYRNTPAAFSRDTVALVLAQEAVAAELHHQLTQAERTFLFMPYMHSESAVIHVEAERLFRDYTASRNYHFELRHKAIIDRFGRYPHRNRILGRVSSAEEESFLLQPGSSF